MSDASEVLLRRQRVLADFGDLALRSENLDQVLAEACRLVADALGTGRAKVLEIDQGGESLLVRAGVGWDPDIVGRLRLPISEGLVRRSRDASNRRQHGVAITEAGRVRFGAMLERVKGFDARLREAVRPGEEDALRLALLRIAAAMAAAGESAAD